MTTPSKSTFSAAAPLAIPPDVLASLKANGATRQTDAVASPRFTVWTPKEFAAFTPPEDDIILGEAARTAGEKDVAYWRDGQTAFLVGPGGTGKSRLTLQLAVTQILGRDFIGFKLPSPPRRWLLLGNENSARRVKDELAAMTGPLPADQQALLNEHLHIQAVVDSTSDCLSLDDPEALMRMEAAASEIRPDILAIDPWEAFIKEGDCNSSPLTRDSIRKLPAIFAKHSQRFALLIVHHSREGSEAIRSAEGFGAGAFAKGSKTFRSMARFGINVAPEDPEEGGRIVLICGKINDARKFETRGAILDEKMSWYTRNPDFNLDEWKDDVEGKRGGKSCSVNDVVAAVRGGRSTTKEIVDAVEEATAAAPRTIKAYLSKAAAGGYLERFGRGQYKLGPKAQKVVTAVQRAA